MQRRGWRYGLAGLVSTFVASTAGAQVTGIGQVQVASQVRIGVPAVAVLSAATSALGDRAVAARTRWRAVLRTGANDRHALSVRGLADGWTVRVSDEGTALRPSGGSIVVSPTLTRGYHEVVLVLEGPDTGDSPIEAVVHTLDVPGGKAVVPIRPAP